MSARREAEGSRAVVAGEPDVRAARLLRAKNYFLALARRAEANPEDAEVLARMLAGRVAEYWEPAFEAAMQAAEELEHSHVLPVIDGIIAKSLRENPDLRLIAKLYNRIPPDTLLLKQTAVEISRQTLDGMERCNWAHLKSGTYFTALFNLFGRLLQLGHWEEAEGLARRALDLARIKHSEDPQTFHEALAISLEATAAVLSAKGEHERCREAREEAIRLRRNNGGDENALAETLINYAATLKSLGDEAGALLHSQEAVRLYRKLVERGKPEGAFNYGNALQGWREAPHPQLAKALIGLSHCQGRAKLRHECLASAKEACDIFFTLSEDFPDQFRDALGLACHNLGLAKVGVGDRDGGLQEYRTALAIFAKLIRINPDVYAPSYTRVLGSLVRGCVAAGLNEETLALAENCVATFRSISETASGRSSWRSRNCFEILKSLYERLQHADGARIIAAEMARVEGTANPE